jgi:hypothetical protein
MRNPSIQNNMTPIYSFRSLHNSLPIVQRQH